MNKVILSLMTLLFLFSCKPKHNNFILKGTFRDKFSDYVYLVKLTSEGPMYVDSTIPDKKGKFILKASIKSPTFFLLKIRESKGINLVAFPGDKINIYVNLQNFDIDYIVENSLESKRILKLMKEYDKTMQTITKLSEKFEVVKNQEDFIIQKAKLDSIYNVTYKKYKDFSTNFILENPCSFASLMALYQTLGMRITVFDVKNDFYLFDKVDSCMLVLYPDAEPVRLLNALVVKVRDEMKIRIGAVAPEIIAIDTSGMEKKLGSIKNKNVLVVFWASWCILCEADINLLKDIYKKFNDKLEIYQFYIEKSKESWIKSVKKENTPWIHVSDLKYWDSEAVDDFKIYDIPYYVLLNNEKKIVARGNNLENVAGIIQNIFIENK